MTEKDLTENASAVLEAARHNAKRSGDQEVDPHHLLEEMCKCPCAAADILKRFVVKLNEIPNQFLRTGERPEETEVLPELSAYSKHVVEHALEYTPEGGNLGTEHLLLGILSESGSEAQRILNDQYHITSEKVKRIIKSKK